MIIQKIIFLIIFDYFAPVAFSSIWIRDQTFIPTAPRTQPKTNSPTALQPTPAPQMGIPPSPQHVVWGVGLLGLLAW